MEQVIGDYVRLKKRGVNLLGLCPFHTEKTPSFTVSPAKGIYKCFGCGKAGNVVNFIMEHDSMNYVQALKFLAGKFNIEWPENTYEDSEEGRLEQSQRESLQILNDWAAAYFENLLWHDEEGENIGLSYFDERGFSEEIIKKFRLGYSKEAWSALDSEAQKNQFSAELLVAAGLVKQHEDGKRYDAYRGRVMFPIAGINGKIIAFAGRHLKKDEKSPKYVNSPETVLYHKSNELYGLFLAKNAIRLHDSVYLVEGYTDVISMHQAGIENVVASSGTSLTEGQIKLIKRFTENVTVLYDGDAAGIKASIRGIDMLLEQGLNVRICLFPDNEDPDSYATKNGAAALRDFLDHHKKDFIFFKSELLLKDAQNDPIKRAQVTKDIVASVSKIPDAIKRAVYIRECAALMKVDENLLLTEMGKARRAFIMDREREFISEVPQQNPEWEEEIREKLDELVHYQEKDIVRLLLSYAAFPVDSFANAAHYILEEIRNPEFEILFEHQQVSDVIEIYRKALETGILPEQSFFTFHPNPLLSAMAADVLSEKHEVSPVWEKRYDVVLDKPSEIYKRDIDSALLRLRLKNIDRLLKENQKDIQQEQDEKNLLIHQSVHQELLEKRKLLTEKIGTVIVK